MFYLPYNLSEKCIKSNRSTPSTTPCCLKFMAQKEPHILWPSWFVRTNWSYQYYFALIFKFIQMSVAFHIPHYLHKRSLQDTAYPKPVSPKIFSSAAAPAKSVIISHSHQYLPSVFLFLLTFTNPLPTPSVIYTYAIVSTR